ncbi:Atypical kinase COQ8, mitochondrial [Cyberlindnera fabianii]|uniref:Atypical kinase COQ8, mitochondrial n=1 Tax=Cyberlindnera fabianii TaxID=36022 RepID=A0A1V2LF81_CYBFA|nr:Atypical kinase COQ8, mitochondrial [Cyberlindnera fabianii]
MVLISREVLFEIITVARSATRVATGSASLLQEQTCDFYKTSGLTKPLRVHDEMYDELHQKAAEIRDAEIHANVATSTSSTSSSASPTVTSTSGKRPTITPSTPPQPTSKREYSTDTKRKSAIPIDSKNVESRYSEMPTSKLQRLFHYGHLATSIGVNTASDSLRAVATGQRPSFRNAALSQKNISILGDKLRKMRGAALKVGQMMSIQDESFLPRELSDILKSVQNQGYFMPPRQLHRIMRDNIGSDWRDKFEAFEDVPIASASISQVHRAITKDGKPVAVKVQYPGVKDSIDSDMDSLLMIMTASRLLPKGMFAESSIGNARTELKWECDFLREAESIKKFGELLKDDPVFEVPKVYDELTTENIITMDWLDGTDIVRGEWDQETRNWLATNVMRLCLQEIAQFKFMQTDPNWANFLYNQETKKIQLLDFGASREYGDEFIHNYVTCLRAGVANDTANVAEYSKRLGYLTGLESQEMVDAHVESITTLGEPFAANGGKPYDFSKQDVTTRVKAKMGLMLRERLTPPPEETYSLHRKFSGVFLLCTRLQAEVPCEELLEKYFHD